MISLTHQQAQMLIRAGQNMSGTEEEALMRHLSTCTECRAYAALVDELHKTVPVLYPSTVYSEKEIRQKAARNRTLVRRQSIMNRISQGARSVVFAGAVLALLFILVILSPRLLPNQPGTGVDPSTVPSTELIPSREPSESTPTSAGSFQYTVAEGENLISIAEKFNLEQKTILWSNTDQLHDDPQNIRPGITLRIPTTNGLYYRWEPGDTIEAVAERFGIDPQAILDWPENAAQIETIENPQFQPQVEVFIPGGEKTLEPTPVAKGPDEVQTEEIPFCDQLVENYTPSDGFKLYCDDQYQYAFDYPLGWEIEGLDRPTPDPTTFPGAYLQVLQFFESNYANQVYIYTGVLPEGSSLLDIAQNHYAYDDRAFKKDYSPMQIGGKLAYGFVNRHVQDYSGVSLFFEHGDYYTLMYMKIISPAGLGVNWQIANSIQVPGALPKDNIISDELIDDSYLLIGAPRPTPTVQATAPVDVSTAEFELYFYRPLVVDYDPAIWSDMSEPDNREMMVNYLQHREIESCTIGVRGPSGFYPENMQDVILGDITYQLNEQKLAGGAVIRDYFFKSKPTDALDDVHNTIGIPILQVQYQPSEGQDCQAAAEVVFATLHPSERLINMPFCEKLARDYRTPPNYITYCDPDYNFAFDYPANWERTLIGTGSEDLSTNHALKIQDFSKPDMSNYIRVATYRLPESSNLEDSFKAHSFYADREFPEHEYAELQIGGQRAYAIVRQWVQDYSAVYLFFQHGEFYTIMEIKAISSPKLDTNWKIARSIQIPGATLEDNFIPDELLIDSYQLVK